MPEWVINLLVGLGSGVLTAFVLVLVSAWKMGQWVSSIKGNIENNVEDIKRVDAKVGETREWIKEYSSRLEKIPVLVDRIENVVQKMEQHEKKFGDVVTESYCDRNTGKVNSRLDNLEQEVRQLSERLVKIER